MTTNGSTPTISPVKQIESLYQRLQKAREIVSQGKVHPIVGLEGHYAVACSRIDKGMYLVNATCTCVDAQQRTDVHHGWCKHKLAVEVYKETPTEPAPEKPRARKGKATDTPTNGAITPEQQEQLERDLADLYPTAS